MPVIIKLNGIMYVRKSHYMLLPIVEPPKYTTGLCFIVQSNTCNLRTSQSVCRTILYAHKCIYTY